MTLIVFRHASDRLFKKLVLQSYFREIWTKCFILGRPEIGFRVRKVLDLGFREDVSILLETFLKFVKGQFRMYILDVTFLNRYTNTNQIMLTRLKKQVQLIIDCGHKKELLCCLEKVPY